MHTTARRLLKKKQKQNRNKQLVTRSRQNQEQLGIVSPNNSPPPSSSFTSDCTTVPKQTKSIRFPRGKVNHVSDYKSHEMRIESSSINILLPLPKLKGGGGKMCYAHAFSEKQLFFGLISRRKVIFRCLRARTQLSRCFSAKE